VQRAREGFEDARAQAALDAAALAISNTWKQRIQASSQLDTIAAARAVLQFDAFRRDASATARAFSHDTSFASEQVRLRSLSRV